VSDVGGFLGNYVSGTLTCCFWGFEGSTLDDIGNNGDDANITQLTPLELQNPSNFSCFDFENTWVSGTDVSPFDYLSPLLRVFVNQNNIIPTLTEWAVITFVVLLAGVGGWFVWRRLV